jgi:hypothetical protein
MKKIALALPVLLAACAAAPGTAPEYKADYKPELAGKPAATLRLSSLHPRPARVGALSGECVPFTVKAFDATTQGIGTLTAKQPAEQAIPAGAPFTFAFFASNTVVTGQIATDENCAVGMRFTPEAGAEYEAVFTGDSENCRMELGKVTSGAARTTPVPGAAQVKSCP